VGPRLELKRPYGDRQLGLTEGVHRLAVCSKDMVVRPDKVRALEAVNEMCYSMVAAWSFP
jgi:hypothetical protein